MNETAQDRTVVLAVVMLLGLVALAGLLGGMWLIHELGQSSSPDASRSLAAEIAVVFTTVGGATGALAGILASTRSAPPAPVQQAQAQGYQQAVADVNALTGSPAAVTVVNTQEQPVPVESTSGATD